MAVVAAEAFIGEAKFAQSERGLAGGGAAVGIAPDAIELMRKLESASVLPRVC